MHELQRMQYLDAMGIDSFVPRVLLAHAKAPSICELPVKEVQNDAASAAEDGFAADALAGEAEPSLAASNSHEKMASPKPAGSIVSSILDQAEKQTRVKQVTTPSHPSVNTSAGEKQTDSMAKQRSPNAEHDEHAVPQAAQEKAQFSLSLWRAGERFEVVDSRTQGEALPTHTLLNNILRGMQLYTENLPGAEILHWPLVGNKDASWGAAEQMVQGFLDGKLAVRPIDYFILMGEQAYRAVLGTKEGTSAGTRADYEKNLYQVVELPEYSAKAVILPSLAQILYDAALKKPVWLALKQLAAKQTK